MKRFTRYTQYTRYTRYTGKKEDVYPLVLAFVGAILGWATIPVAAIHYLLTNKQ